jgi:GntR family transcriptional regulator, transcriptional repressor for pyruvate dehydrogenase complex
VAAEPAIDPIRRPPLYEEVAQRIKAYAEQAGLQPGDRLPPERDLAKQLGVSRSSIRQALTLLRTMGLVEPRQGDGIYLRRAPADIQPEITATLLAAQRQLPTIMEAREAMESQLARLAARRRSPDDLQRLRAAVNEMAQAIQDGTDPAPADGRFHAAVAQAADSPLLEDLMRQLADPIALTRGASLSRQGRPPRSLEGHRRILEAIEARDENGADSAMREHLMVVAGMAHAPAAK